MWEKIRTVFSVPELRQKIFLTLFLLAIFRLGSWIPLPIVDSAKVADMSQRGGTMIDLMNKVAALSASQLTNATIFGLGIMPYISASIIFQLLGTVWGPLERLQKEGETGRKKINEYTRYATVVLSFFQSWIYVSTFVVGFQLVNDKFLTADGSLMFRWHIICTIIMTGGTVFLMWLGEQIDEFGIGNGISLLIMAGIVASMPGAFQQLAADTNWELASGSGLGLESLVVLAALFVAVVIGVVFITLGQRRIPTQSAKHVRGRRVYGGTRQYLPLRVNQAGVMPIIFASSLLLFPTMLFSSFQNSTFFQTISAMMAPNAYTYNLLYVALIYFFCYFWTAIIFNPKDMADNLKNMGSFIPGYRPGRRTADYLEKVMVRITYVGAGFLALVAIIPTLITTSMGVNFTVASFYGGTSLLIAVSVAFDLVQKIDSHLVMRNYRGLLEK